MHEREDAGERGLLDAAAVGRAEDGNAEAGQPAGEPGEQLHRVSRDGFVNLPGGAGSRAPRVVHR